MFVYNHSLTNMNQRRLARDADIRAEYARQHKAGLRDEVIIARLEIRWRLAPTTLDKIIFQQGHYRPVVVVTETSHEASAV